MIWRYFRKFANMNRSQKIIPTSVIGIVANVLLAAFKAVVGILVDSVVFMIGHNFSELKKDKTKIFMKRNSSFWCRQ